MAEKKILILIIVFTLFFIGAAVFFLSKSPTKPNLEKTFGAKIENLETSYDFKDIPYDGGDAIHNFKIKNVGDKPLKIANLATSCMCTKVYFQNNQGQSPRFGMKGSNSVSGWTGVLNPGEEGSVVADFDPTAHGPAGVGPISRLVSIETNDPDHPYIEFSFSGKVVK